MSNIRCTAESVAQYIILQGQRRDAPPSHLALQKLLYFVQRDWLREKETPLFDDDFEAWQFGPVIRSVYRHYCIYGSSPIWEDIKAPALSETVCEFIRQKYDTYKVASPWDLVSATHQKGTAWHEVWNNGIGRGKVICKKLIKKEQGNAAE